MQVMEIVRWMPEVSGKLDVSLCPGEKSRTRWEMNVGKALSSNPEFTQAGNEGRATVWRLNEAHMPAKPASKVIQCDKGKFMAKGKSMGQGGH